jgi:hypothetical protein
VDAWLKLHRRSCRRRRFLDGSIAALDSFRLGTIGEISTPKRHTRRARCIAQA